jgi:hypothetical protein
MIMRRTFELPSGGRVATRTRFRYVLIQADVQGRFDGEILKRSDSLTPIAAERRRRIGVVTSTGYWVGDTETGKLKIARGDASAMSRELHGGSVPRRAPAPFADPLVITVTVPDPGGLGSGEACHIVTKCLHGIPPYTVTATAVPAPRPYIYALTDYNRLRALAHEHITAHGCGYQRAGTPCPARDAFYDAVTVMGQIRLGHDPTGE